MNIIHEKNVLFYIKMFDGNRLVMILMVYFICYGILLWLKPGMIYDESKRLRSFGVGYKHTTILPLWLVSIFLAIFSYFVVLYFIHIRYSTLFMI